MNYSFNLCSDPNPTLQAAVFEEFLLQHRVTRLFDETF